MKTLFFKLASRLNLVTLLHLLLKSSEILILYLKLGLENKLDLVFHVSNWNHLLWVLIIIFLQDDPNKTPASARHKRGCNCKKSSCLKKYCECYQVFTLIPSCMFPILVITWVTNGSFLLKGGVGCSISCRCEGCKNAFGRKDGKFSMRTIKSAINLSYWISWCILIILCGN